VAVRNAVNELGHGESMLHDQRRYASLTNHPTASASKALHTRLFRSASRIRNSIGIDKQDNMATIDTFRLCKGSRDIFNSPPYLASQNIHVVGFLSSILFISNPDSNN